MGWGGRGRSHLVLADPRCQKSTCGRNATMENEIGIPWAKSRLTESPVDGRPARLASANDSEYQLQIDNSGRKCGRRKQDMTTLKRAARRAALALGLALALAPVPGEPAAAGAERAHYIAAEEVTWN